MRSRRRMTVLGYAVLALLMLAAACAPQAPAPAKPADKPAAGATAAPAANAPASSKPAGDSKPATTANKPITASMIAGDETIAKDRSGSGGTLTIAMSAGNVP